MLACGKRHKLVAITLQHQRALSDRIEIVAQIHFQQDTETARERGEGRLRVLRKRCPQLTRYRSRPFVALRLERNKAP